MSYVGTFRAEERRGGERSEGGGLRCDVNRGRHTSSLRDCIPAECSSHLVAPWVDGPAPPPDLARGGEAVEPRRAEDLEGARRAAPFGEVRPFEEAAARVDERRLVRRHV